MVCLIGYLEMLVGSLGWIEVFVVCCRRVRYIFKYIDYWYLFVNWNVHSMIVSVVSGLRICLVVYEFGRFRGIDEWLKVLSFPMVLNEVIGI